MAPTTTTPSSVTEMIQMGGDDVCIHIWNKDLTSSKATVVIYHGFGAHGLYPTVRYAAEFLATTQNYQVLAADMRGHGQTPGLQGYLPGVDILLEDAKNVAEYAMTTLNNNNGNNNKKLFLLGSSMGGTIALEVAQRLMAEAENNQQQPPSAVVAGVLLLAPMLKLSVSPIEQYLLQGLAYIIPQVRAIPSSTSNPEKQYRDAIKREECENDSYTSKSSSIYVGSANTCVTLANRVSPQNTKNVPFWLGVAMEDSVVKPEGSLEFYDKAVSKDKTMKQYAALHGLLCEPKPLYDEIVEDILQWMAARC